MSGFLDIPSDPAPSGLQIFALFINFFFPAVALVVVVTRAAGRLATNQFGWDDWLVCVAMLMSLAETIVSFFLIKTNFIGIHFDQIPIHDPTEGLIWTYAVQILYNPILALVKSSALIFLLRLFGQKDRVRRFIIWLNVVNLVSMVAVFFAIMFQCLPVAFNWDLTIRGGHCVDRRVLYTCTSVVNIVTDLLVLGLPIWIFTDLKIPPRKKFGLMFVFLLGFLTTITSIVRLVIFVQDLFGLIVLTDPTFNIGFITSAIEINLALITTSAPALRPIFRSRDHGGWLPRSSLFPRRSTDPEMGQSALSKSIRWGDESKVSVAANANGNSTTGGGGGGGIGGRFGRGGSLARGSRRGGLRSGRNTSSRNGGGSSGSGKKPRPIIRLRTDLPPARELRSSSPRASEEETMTADGIIKVSDIQREIDGIVKEIAVEGKGTYTGVKAKERPVVPKIQTSVQPRQAPRPSLDSARPSTSGSTGTGAGRRFADKYYSASIYPDADAGWPLSTAVSFTDEGAGGSGRDYSEERLSKYGDRRYGVVTPRGTTPTTKSWKESGRPF